MNILETNQSTEPLTNCRPLPIMKLQDMVELGAWMVRLVVDTENGGLAIDDSFLVDFGKEPGGPVLAH